MATDRTPHQLPEALNPLIGRERETAEVQRLLETAPLLTLTGPGGGGKSRLALAAAWALLPSLPGGAWWCDLNALADPAAVPQAVAAALRVGEQPGRAVAETLADFFHKGRALLVLDGCEYVLAGAAALANSLLPRCPDLRIMATSLQPLGLPAEQARAVPPLEVPPGDALAPEALNACPSVRLFVERAAAVQPGFTLSASNAAAVAVICRELEGLPLALELAAARVKMLSVGEIAQRLEGALQLLTRGAPDLLPRHQTLRATLDWGHHLLGAPEQVLFRRLSVFAGTFTLEAIEAICGDGALPTAQLLDLLTDLCEKSLVSRDSAAQQAAGPARFRLLDTVRQYAREKLEAEGETAELRDRHLVWYREWAEPVMPKLTGPEQVTWLNYLDGEHDNLRAALRWACLSQHTGLGLALAMSVWRFWFIRSYLSEGRAWLEELLSLDEVVAAEEKSTAEVRARALYAAAALAFRQRDRAQAAALAEASLALARTTGDRALLTQPLNLLAILASEQGDYARATTLHQEVLDLQRAAGDPAGIGTSLLNLGVIARSQGDFQRAVTLYEEALALKRRVGDRVNAALALGNLGEIAVFQGDYPRANALLAEGLALYTELGNKTGAGMTLNNLGVAARNQGDLARAEALFGQGLAQLQEAGDRVHVGIGRLNLGDLAHDRGDLAQARAIYAECLATFRETGERWGSALALHLLGLVAHELKDPALAWTQHAESLAIYRDLGYRLGMAEALEAMAELARGPAAQARAARWLGAAAAGREAMQAPIMPVDKQRCEAATAALRAALGEAGWAAAWSAGQSLTLAQAVSEALGSSAPAAAPAPPKTRAPELRIYALGPARVLLAGRTLAAGEWTYTKSKELLFYLLSHPGATKAQIGLDLWPEASPEQLRNIFHRALHHLRRALGGLDWVIFADGQYSFNQALAFEYDVQEFERHLQAARGAARAAIAHLEAAAQLWQGDFLADMQAGDWAVYRREALRQALLDGLLRLGQLHYADARYQQAANAYQRALAFDDYLELAHRELMRCYARQGETGQALRHYQRLSELLASELDARPSPETKLLYERLRRGDDV